jgi:predicted nucleic acid-binding protein
VTIDELVGRHRRIALDSNVVIYLFEDEGPAGEAAALVLDAVGDGRFEGVLATVGLTEILTRPAAAGDGALFERYVEALRTFPNLRLVPLGPETAIDAAWGRSAERDLGDAIHVATARSAGATAFITNDSRVRPRTGVEIVRLEGLVA